MSETWRDPVTPTGRCEGRAVLTFGEGRERKAEDARSGLGHCECGPDFLRPSLVIQGLPSDTLASGEVRVKDKGRASIRFCEQETWWWID